MIRTPGRVVETRNSTRNPGTRDPRSSQATFAASSHLAINPIEKDLGDLMRLTLNDHEVKQIMEVTDELSRRYRTVEAEEFQIEARIHSDRIPIRVRRRLNEFRILENDGVLIISGLPVDDEDVGPTPTHWNHRELSSTSLRHDIAFFLLSSFIGDPIGWATQQSGHVMHDIVPIKGHEKEQMGSGSMDVLAWHTEDAFHPLRTDYIGLMCLRNHDAVETTVAQIKDVELKGRDRDALMRKVFTILPDNSHREEHQGNGHDDDPRTAELKQQSYERIMQMVESPEKISVLFGDPNDPYIRIDPYFMQHIRGTAEWEVLETLINALDDVIVNVVLRPGDICLIDNYRTVHGRNAFQPRFDGTDRWLRRLNIARDLRKSRGARQTATSRVIY